MTSKRIGNRTAAIVAVLATAFSTNACVGSGDEQEPAITDPSDVLKDVALKYDSQTPAATPTRVKVTQGQMAFIAVLSDVPGTVSVEGHNVTRPVRANKVSTVVISANDAGTFDVTLHGKRVDATLAELEVRR